MLHLGVLWVVHFVGVLWYHVSCTLSMYMCKLVHTSCGALHVSGVLSLGCLVWRTLLMFRIACRVLCHARHVAFVRVLVFLPCFRFLGVAEHTRHCSGLAVGSHGAVKTKSRRAFVREGRGEISIIIRWFDPEIETCRTAMMAPVKGTSPLLFCRFLNSHYH